MFDVSQRFPQETPETPVTPFDPVTWAGGEMLCKIVCNPRKTWERTEAVNLEMEMSFSLSSSHSFTELILFCRVRKSVCQYCYSAV